jgi:hypothetical protein
MPRGVTVQIHTFLTPATLESECSASLPGRFSRRRSLISSGQGVGWATKTRAACNRYKQTKQVTSEHKISHCFLFPCQLHSYPTAVTPHTLAFHFWLQEQTQSACGCSLGCQNSCMIPHASWLDSQMATHQTHGWKVSGSNLGPETTSPDWGAEFSTLPTDKWQDKTFPSDILSFTIH